MRAIFVGLFFLRRVVLVDGWLFFRFGQNGLGIYDDGALGFSVNVVWTLLRVFSRIALWGVFSRDIFRIFQGWVVCSHVKQFTRRGEGRAVGYSLGWITKLWFGFLMIFFGLFFSVPREVAVSCQMLATLADATIHWSNALL